MRSERLLTATLALFPLACSGEASAPAAPEEKISRTDSVKVAPKSAASADKSKPPGWGFCEMIYDPGQRPFTAPAERPIPGAKPVPSEPGRWTYLNLWATWCKPCLEEMGLFARWKEALAKDGLPINLELWSIDAAADQGALAARVATGLPGEPRWVESEEAFGKLLETLGLDKTAAIPIHVLIDGQKNVRCVRVGSIHPEDYAQVKAMVQSK